MHTPPQYKEVVLIRNQKILDSLCHLLGCVTRNQSLNFPICQMDFEHPPILVVMRLNEINAFLAGFRGLLT